MVRTPLDYLNSSHQTEEKQQRGLVDTLTRQLRVGCLILDHTQVIIYNNPMAASLLGCPTGSLFGRSGVEIFGDHLSLLTTKRDSASHQFLLPTSSTDDNPGQTSVTIAPVSLENRLFYWVTLTAIREMDEWTEQLIINERLANIGTLTVSIAHELTNPISIILTTCTNIEDDLSLGQSPPAELAHYIQMIQGNALRCARLLETLRSYNHNGTFREKTPLNLVIEHALSLLSPNLKIGIILSFA